MNEKNKYINVIYIVLVGILISIIVLIFNNLSIPKNQNKEDDIIKESKIEIKPYEVPESKGEKNIEKDKNTYDGIQTNGTIEGKIKVYISETNKVVEMSLEDYVKGVVASEMPALFENEALKAQAVAARTYAVSRLESLGGKSCNIAKRKGGNICDTVHCQVFMDKEKLIKRWKLDKSNEYWNKINSAVESTSGEVITYNNTIIDMPLYFSVSGGMTEESRDVFGVYRPYLVSVESYGEEIAPRYMQTFSFTKQDFINKLKLFDRDINLSNENLSESIKVKSRNDSGSILELAVANSIINSTDFRRILGLNSTKFEIIIQEENIIINCIGFGHGVGMSQWGANAMAKDNNTYKQILSHYYQNTSVLKLKYQ